MLSRMATEMKRAGHRVRLIAHASHGDLYHESEAEYVRIDNKGRQVQPGDNASQLPRGPWGVVKNLFSLYRALRRYARNSDLVLANHSLIAWPVALARVGRKRAYYVQAYEPDYYFAESRWEDRILGLMARASYLLPLRQIVNSPSYLDHPALSAQYAVPPGIDFEVFKPASALPPSPPLIVGCIGRLEPFKGTRYVFEAVQQLVSEGAPIQLVSAYHIPPDMPTGPWHTHVVPQSDLELAEFYRGLHVLVSPAIGQQGAPHYPVLEALASGIPVIATRFMGMNEANSWLVREYNSQDIVAALINALRGEGELIAKKSEGARGTKLSKLGWENVAKELVDVATE